MKKDKFTLILDGKNELDLYENKLEDGVKYATGIKLGGKVYVIYFNDISLIDELNNLIKLAKLI